MSFCQFVVAVAVRRRGGRSDGVDWRSVGGVRRAVSGGHWAPTRARLPARDASGVPLDIDPRLLRRWHRARVSFIIMFSSTRAKEIALRGASRGLSHECIGHRRICRGGENCGSQIVSVQNIAGCIEGEKWSLLAKNQTSVEIQICGADVELAI